MRSLFTVEPLLSLSGGNVTALIQHIQSPLASKLSPNDTVGDGRTTREKPTTIFRGTTSAGKSAGFGVYPRTSAMEMRALASWPSVEAAAVDMDAAWCGRTGRLYSLLPTRKTGRASSRRLSPGFAAPNSSPGSSQGNRGAFQARTWRTTQCRGSSGVNKAPPTRSKDDNNNKPPPHNPPQKKKRYWRRWIC